MSYLDLDFHRGLMAALNDAYHEEHEDDPPELRFYRGVIERGGQPALDAGCGAGRLLLPMLVDGFDVDGSDLSPDMLDRCRAKALRLGVMPTLHEAATGHLRTGRRYRTIVMNGSLAINGTRDDDVASLRRAYELLEPGGTVAFDVGPGWSDRVVWERAAAPGRLVPTPWSEPSTTPTPEGDAIVDSERVVLVDPLEQRYVKDLCIDLVRDGHVVTTEMHRVVVRWYAPGDLIPLLGSIGFVDVRVTGDFTEEPVRAEHDAHVYIATKPG